MFEIFRRLFRGEILKTGETLISAGTTAMTMVLKKDKQSGEVYATLKLITAGEFVYHYLNPSELDQFLKMARVIERALQSHRAEQPL